MTVVGAVGGAATSPTSGAPYPKRASHGGAGGAAEPSLCAREVTACSNDAECGGFEAMVVGLDWGKTAGLPVLGGSSHGGAGGAAGGAGLRGDLFFQTESSATHCEKIGATICRALTAAAPSGQEEREDRQAGGMDDSQSVGNCLGNRVVQALLACRLQTAGCEPGDAPCTVPAEEGAAYAKAYDDGISPQLAIRNSRRAVVLPRDGICDGIVTDNVCCAAKCIKCGGRGCSTMGGADEDCCTGNVLESGTLCSDTGGAPPCIIVKGTE